jgi:hypothetical protein
MSRDGKFRPHGHFDADLEFKDAGLVAASAAAQVDSADKIVNVGTGYFLGLMEIDISAIEIDTNDERYDIIVQGSTSSSFADTIVPLAQIQVGANEVLDGDVDSSPGKYQIPFTNERDGVYYPYLRLYTKVAGTITTGINYTAYARKVA